LSTIVCAWSPDWIVLGADSRITLVKQQAGRVERVLFFDEAEKVFVFPDSMLGMACAGPAVFDGQPFSYRINKFIETEDQKGRSPSEILRLFVSSLVKDEAGAVLGLSATLFLLVAGFCDGGPQCASFRNRQLSCQAQMRGVLSNDAAISKKRPKGASVPELVRLVASSIRQRGADGRAIRTTGGAIDILAISKQECVWIQRKGKVITPATEASLVDAIYTFGRAAQPSGDGQAGSA
jgi:hypothetical protein